jgi:hypothetical protein
MADMKVSLLLRISCTGEATLAISEQELPPKKLIKLLNIFLMKLSTPPENIIEYPSAFKPIRMTDKKI